MHLYCGQDAPHQLVAAMTPQRLKLAVTAPPLHSILFDGCEAKGTKIQSRETEDNESTITNGPLAPLEDISTPQSEKIITRKTKTTRRNSVN